jgi:hypothetical protein
MGKLASMNDARAIITLPEKAIELMILQDLTGESRRETLYLAGEFSKAEKAEKVEDMAIFSSAQKVQLGLQNTEQDFRVLIIIDNEKSLYDYRFIFHLQEGQKLVIAKEDFDTGEFI